MNENGADQTFWLGFIRLYRQLPALWKVKSKEYCDRKLKNEAYKVLIEMMKEVDSGANRDTVTRKINNLRSNYRKELKKVKDSQNSGNVYHPTVWHYEEMNFLKELETFQDPTSMSSSRDKNKNVRILQEDSSDVANKGPKRTNFLKRRIEEMDPKKRIKIEAPNLQSRDVEECKILSKSWAFELRKMLPEQQTLAKKAINDILFQGQTGALNKD